MSSEGLTSETSGNISVHNREEGLMAISPLGIGYFETNPKDVVIMNLQGEIVEGDRKPSSEWGHKVKPACEAAIHTHSMYCTVFASLNQPLRAVHYVIGDAGTATVPCAPYEIFGTEELAQSVARTIGESNAVLLANHGMLACGADIESAYGLAKGMEYCAELQYRCMCIGNPVILSDDEMDVVMEKFKSYGQKK